MTKEKNNNSSANSDIETNKNIAALSYIWILCLVPLLGKKNSKICAISRQAGFGAFYY
ncbi:MAG: hypothetical protein WC582_04680 [Patescibacteria group bacterium]